MSRPVLTLATAALLALPAAGSAQDRSADQSNGVGTSNAAVQAEVFEEALREISLRHRQVFSDSALWAQALDGLVESLDDPYAAVFTPEEVAAFEEENTGNYSGIGITITQLNAMVTVTAVFRDTPADQAGIMVGDVIVGVDGADAREWTTEDVSNEVRGEEGSTVRVSVQRDGMERPISFDLTRAEVHVPAVRASMITEDVGYVTVERVARNSAREVDAAIQSLDDPGGLVLDLRRNPGGFLNESLLMADLFLEPGKKLASLQTRAAGRDAGEVRDESWDARMPARIPQVPIVVLVDEFTASASEIVAGALQDHDRALVLGARTFGKGVVQDVRDLPHGHKLRLTTGTWYTPLGRSLHRARDGSGRPVADGDSASTVVTAAGREIPAAGGVFPDLEVADDTLRAPERALLQEASDAELPLAVRIQEFAFEQARLLAEAGESPRLDEAAFSGFVAGLVGEGIPAPVLEDPVARDYLAWRVRFTIADRMSEELTPESLRIRLERDRVLSRAVELLRSSESQSELFAQAREAEVSDADAPADPEASRPGG